MTKQKLIDEINYKMKNALKIKQIMKSGFMSAFWEGYYKALDDILNIIDIVDED